MKISKTGDLSMEARSRCFEARQLLSEGALLLDVRTVGEFNKGALDGAINVPLNTLKQSSLGVPANSPILIYCVSGVLSSEAKNHLEEKGHRNVYDLGSYKELKNC